MFYDIPVLGTVNDLITHQNGQTVMSILQKHIYKVIFLSISGFSWQETILIFYFYIIILLK